ncbi:MAG: hypothetical protein C0458_09310 [Methylobacterium sp.]|nr:hypothetical protein [Methylobacterium sp.]
MANKPSTQARVLDVVDVTISRDAAEGAIIKLSIDGSTDVELVFDALTLARLQAILAEADRIQAEEQRTQ